MTKKQIESIQFLYTLLIDSGVDINNVKESDFHFQMKDKKKMIPWKVFNLYKKPDGIFQFGEMFTKALGNTSEVQMPESFPMADFVDLTPKKPSKPKKPEKAEKGDNLPVKKDPPKKSTKAPPPPSLTAGVKIIHFEDPVFLVESVDSTGETAVVGITKKWDKASGTLLNRAIHDHGKLTKEQAKDTVDHKGVVIIQSNTSNYLYCVITKMELE